jgi:hypothetical protein
MITGRTSWHRGRSGHQRAALDVRPTVRAGRFPWARRTRTALPGTTGRAQVRQVETPAALLEAAGLPRVDFTDTFILRLPPGSSRDVEDWHRALLTADVPPWVAVLMAWRNRVARALGLDTAGRPTDTSPFSVLTRTGDTLVVGADDKHLDFRGVLRVVGDDLQCATVVQEHNTTGRAYFAVVKPFHRRIVPALLERAGSGRRR